MSPDQSPEKSSPSTDKPRQLGEDVLQSSEEAVLGSADTTEDPAQGVDGADKHSSLRAYVAREPVRAAGLALVAGALVAACLRAIFQRRSRRRSR